MPRWLKFSCLLLPLLAALVALVDTPLHVLTRGELAGIFEAVPRPKFRLRECWNGKFQEQFEHWFEQSLAFRPGFVRSENTLNLAVFREISANLGIPVVLGKKHTLFEQNYINNLNGVSDLKGDPPPRSPEPPEESAARLGRAARAFNALGVSFVMVFYPSKAWLETDRVPERYRLSGGKERALQGYQHFMRALRRNRVPFIDGVDVAQRFALEHPEIPLWNRGGGHWSDPVACTFVREIVAHAAQQTIVRQRLKDASPPEFRCNLGEWAPAQDVDVDLAELINVWNIRSFVEPIPRVTPELASPPPGGPLDVLIIGTSYSVALERLLQASGAVNGIKRFQYFRSWQRAKLSLPADIRGNRLVIFEQWQWSYLTINITDFLNELERRVPRFAELARERG